MWKMNVPIIRPPTAPMHESKFFSPYFVRNVQPSYMREAELKHCRLAMIALPFTEVYIFQFLCFLMCIYEYKVRFAWDTPFTLKENYQPGDLGLGIWDKEDGDLMDKELNHGRLAIILVWINYFSSILYERYQT